jgi:hypothetical protein
MRQTVIETLEFRRLLCAEHHALPADLQAMARSDDGHILQSDFLRARPEFVGKNLWTSQTFNPLGTDDISQWLYDPHWIESEEPVTHPDVPSRGPRIDPLLPDLIPLTGGSYLAPYIDTTEISGHTLLRFTTGIGNMGAGPAILSSSNTGTPPAGSGITSWINPDGTQNVLQRLYHTSGSNFVFNSYRPAGRMIYHSSHGHFHLDGYARYRLLTNVNGEAGPVAMRSNFDNSEAVGDKIGFCLIDLVNSFTLPNGSSSSTLPGYSYGGRPNTGCGFLQGINVGRADVYNSIYDGQWIDVTGVPNGSYFLEVTIDALDVVQESNDANNTVFVPVTLNTSTAPGGIMPDRYEPNNTFEQATDFGELGVQTQPGLTIHITDEPDYFRFTAASSGTYSVQLIVGNRDVNLYVYDSDRTLLKSSTSSAVGPTSESVSVAFNAGQTYYVMARGFGTEEGTGGISSNYAVVVNVLPTVGMQTPADDAGEASAVPGRFELTRNGPYSNALAVNFTLTGSATRGVDYDIYQDGLLITGNTVTIGVETLTAVLDVVPLNDSSVEAVEIAKLTLAAGAYAMGTADSGIVSIADTPPTVTASAFNFETLPLSLAFDFSLDVSASLGLDDIDIIDLASEVQLVPTSMRWEESSNRVLFEFGSSLPDGEYRAVLAAAGVTHALGAPLATDQALDFFVLAGDADRDRDVDVNDLGILSSNWQQSPRTFSQGDFDFSGTVDVNDLGILASRWQQTLAAPSAMPGQRPSRRPIDRIFSLLQ